MLSRSANGSARLGAPRAQARRNAVVMKAGDAGVASTSKCSTCGMDRSKAPGGCDGEGRVIGGLAAVPGFGWWPIKAYRPCPGLEQAGLEYTRKGQGTNEMLFGGVSLGQSGQQSLDKMQGLADKGIEVDLETPKK